MKFPKKTKRYCPYCKKHTEHKVGIVSPIIKRGALKYGSMSRAKKRGRARGFGNLGRYSKPAISKWKRKTKATKKIVLIYTCQVCKKSKLAKYGRRSSRGQLKEGK